jgi:xanthine dehydrogenase YagS FAD-binding subunit
MKLGVVNPTGLVQVKGQRSSLSSITIERDGIRIGAASTMAELERHSTVRLLHPAVHMSVALAASPQIREMATVGGNLLQRTRCSYFRNLASRCNKRDPGTGCDALDGDNKNLAFLGGSTSCIASYPGDLAVALTMLNATIDVKKGENSRTIPIRSFYKLPSDSPHFENALEEGELITSIKIPSDLGGQSYVKLRDRASYAFAIASAAVSIELHGSVVADAKLALGGVATVPWLCEDIAGMLRGKRLDEELALKVGQTCLADAKPTASQTLRVELSARVIARALMDASEVARQRLADAHGHR